MSRLEQMFEDFWNMPEEEQEIFVRKYREKRAEELNSVQEIKKREHLYTAEERELIKKLGLTFKDLAKLKETVEEEESEEEEDENEELEVE